jgi:hypothetical protein
MTHDQLQSSAHLWLWNQYPELRQLFHSNFSDIKIIESVLRSTTGQSIGEARGIIISKLKAVGLVKGTYDQELLYKGRMYYFDAKLPSDRLSPEQLSFKEVNERHGAECYTYATMEEFQNMFYNILENGNI